MPRPRAAEEAAMRRGSRVFAVFAGSLAVFVMGSGLLLATTGVATVRVKEKQADGVHLYLPVPALVLYAGSAILPLAMPPAERARIAAGLGGRRQAIADVLEEL